MSDAPVAEPICFISYRGEDAERGKLHDFCVDLRAQLQGRKPNTLVKTTTAFQDRVSVSAGDDWEAEILEALKTSRVFVAMFTPAYFQRLDKPCYCGREFQAFLARSGGERSPKANILPVMWLTPGPHEREYPPEVVSWVARQLEGKASPAAKALYEAEGLESVWLRKGRQTYMNLVLDIVNRVLELSRNPPPSATTLPSLAEIPCAFHDHEEESGLLPDVPSAPEPGGGPSRVVVTYVTDGDDVDRELIEAGIRRAIRRHGNVPVARRWNADSGLNRLRDSVLRAAGGNAIPLVAVTASHAARPPVADAIATLVDTPGWIGGVAVVGRGGPALASSDSVFARVLTGGEQELRAGLERLITDIEARMHQNADIVSAPAGPDPEVDGRW